MCFSLDWRLTSGRASPQGFDKGTTSVGAAKTVFRKAPKSDNVYLKLLVKVRLFFPSPRCREQEQR